MVMVGFQVAELSPVMPVAVTAGATPVRLPGLFAVQVAVPIWVITPAPLRPLETVTALIAGPGIDITGLGDVVADGNAANDNNTAAFAPTLAVGLHQGGRRSAVGHLDPAVDHRARGEVVHDVDPGPRVVARTDRGVHEADAEAAG